MRKNLEIVDKFRAYGFDFVCIPVNGNKAELVRQSSEAFDKILSEIEGDGLDKNGN
jgi:hypothetical protein